MSRSMIVIAVALFASSAALAKDLDERYEDPPGSRKGSLKMEKDKERIVGAFDDNAGNSLTFDAKCVGQKCTAKIKLSKGTYVFTKDEDKKVATIRGGGMKITDGDRNAANELYGYRAVFPDVAGEELTRVEDVLSTALEGVMLTNSIEPVEDMDTKKPTPDQIRELGPESQDGPPWLSPSEQIPEGTEGGEPYGWFRMEDDTCADRDVTPGRLDLSPMLRRVQSFQCCYNCPTPNQLAIQYLWCPGAAWMNVNGPPKTNHWHDAEVGSPANWYYCNPPLPAPKHCRQFWWFPYGSRAYDPFRCNTKPCAGRCGAGCRADNRSCGKWTADCLNHDLCTSGHITDSITSPVAPNCGDEFREAADDWQWGVGKCGC